MGKTESEAGLKLKLILGDMELSYVCFCISPPY